MEHIAKLKNPDNRCDDCIQHHGDWCCTMNCSNAEFERFQPFGEPEKVELRMCDDGTPRWHMATRDGWQVVGSADGAILTLQRETYAVGTKLTLCEPIITADQPS